MEPATALNLVDDNSAVSEVGSQDISLGKFKNAKALLDAYNNLQAEFTKKCQQLSSLKQDKMEKEKTEEIQEKIEELQENHENLDKNQKNNVENDKLSEENMFDKLNSFLETNNEAENYRDEIQSHYLNENQNPFEKAWASVVLSHIKNSDNKIDDPIINQYILNDESVKNKIIENYLNELNSSKPPIIISSQSGERVSGVKSDNPKTLAEAKEMVNKMFS